MTKREELFEFEAPANLLKAAHSGAIFSKPQPSHRYVLWRMWAPAEPYAVFVMLNPSVAGAEENDATITRQIRRVQGWRRRGHRLGGLVVVNLFARVSTDWRLLRAEMRAGGDVVGVPKNDEALVRFVQARDGGPVVCGWGSHADEIQAGRAAFVLGLLRTIGAEPKAFAKNADGSPVHPLYVEYEAPLIDL